MLNSDSEDVTDAGYQEGDSGGGEREEEMEQDPVMAEDLPRLHIRFVVVHIVVKVVFVLAWYIISVACRSSTGLQTCTFSTFFSALQQCRCNKIMRTEVVRGCLLYASCSST